MQNPVSKQRSENMRCIHAKDTKIELALREVLIQHGYGYRKNWAELPGKPHRASRNALCGRGVKTQQNCEKKVHPGVPVPALL